MSLLHRVTFIKVKQFFIENSHFRNRDIPHCHFYAGRNAWFKGYIPKLITQWISGISLRMTKICFLLINHLLAITLIIEMINKIILGRQDLSVVAISIGPYKFDVAFSTYGRGGGGM